MTCLHGSEINTTFSHKEPLSGFGKNVKDALDLFSSTDNINSEIEPKLATWNESLRANNESLLYSGTIENVVSRHFPNGLLETTPLHIEMRGVGKLPLGDTPIVLKTINQYWINLLTISIISKKVVRLGLEKYITMCLWNKF